MTDPTQDQLRAYADRLAVEVMKWIITVDKDWVPSDSEFASCMIYDEGFPHYANQNGEKMMDCDDWKPWADLSQAWMVAYSINYHNTTEEYNKFLKALPDNDFGCLIDLNSEQAARAIFDAAVQAMGWEVE